MIWILAGVVVAAAVLFVVRNKPAVDALSNVRLRKQEAAALPELQKASLASDVRDLALTGYDRGSAKARDAGENEQFAHEVGVLDAIYCVLANAQGARANPRIRVAMEMESVPFNLLDPRLGRGAVAEYLVWKFFPEWADEDVLDRAMREFIRTFFDRVRSESDPNGAIQRMIYSNRYDWQTLAAQQVRESVGGNNG